MSRTEGTYEIHYYYVTIGGLSSEMRNRGSFWQGFASGAAASLISGAVGGVCGPQHLNVPVVWAKTAMIAAGGLAGGVSASIAGGEFIDGFCNGLICAGLNHALHFVAAKGRDPIMLKNIEKFKMNFQRDQKISMKLCKYYCLEAIGKYFGFQESMGDYRTTGERMIFKILKRQFRK